jgi:hypothetical protein
MNAGWQVSGFNKFRQRHGISIQETRNCIDRSKPRTCLIEILRSSFSSRSESRRQDPDQVPSFHWFQRQPWSNTTSSSLGHMSYLESQASTVKDRGSGHGLLRLRHNDFGRFPKGFVRRVSVWIGFKAGADLFFRQGVELIPRNFLRIALPSPGKVNCRSPAWGLRPRCRSIPIASR